MNHEDLKRPPNTLTARQACDLIEEIRKALALGATEEIKVKNVNRAFREYGFLPLTECKGEAHENPHIDHCGRCMPRWGLVGAPVRIGASKPSGFR